MGKNSERLEKGSSIARLQASLASASLPYCILIVSAYVTTLVIFSFLVVRFGLRDSWLYLFVMPSVISAFFFKRRLYLFMLGALFVAALWVTSQVSSDFGASLTTIAVSAVSSVTLSETIHALVAAQERAEAALRESEEHYQRLVELSPDLIAIHRDGELLYINEAGAELLGFSSPEQAIGKMVTDFVVPFRRVSSEERIQQLVREGQKSPVYDQTIIRPDGTEREVEVVGVPLMHQGSTAVQIMAHDVTERKWAGEALRTRLHYEEGLTACSQALQTNTPESLTAALQHLLEATDVSRVYIFENFVDDGELCMRQIAEACATGIDPQIDNPQLQHLPYEEASPELAAHLSRGEHFEIQASSFTPQERSTLEPQGILSLLILPIQVAGEWYGYMGFDDCKAERDWQSSDIHLLCTATEMIGRYIERRRAEDEIQAYAAELERSNRDLEKFGYVVSHDLQAPLRVVKSYLQLLEDRYGHILEAKAKDYVDYAMDGSERMSEMIRALLNLSRVGTRGEEFAPIDCEALLEDVLNDLALIIDDAGAKVTHDPLPTLMADKAQLSQVFQNLIANGIKFCKEDVPPRVHISASPSPPWGEGRGEGEWLFSVADNGIGADPEQAELIFQVFQRLHTEEEYPGLGIGLALCKRILKRHGGRIWFDSEAGEGATFFFTIPVRGAEI